MTGSAQTMAAIPASRPALQDRVGWRAPSATFRVQFGPTFGFAAARALLPFLQRLGVTALYLSPIFAARQGSQHGYDVVDPRRLNPQLGTPQDFDRLAAAAARLGIGLILDMVPNHMAACAENPWWEDVLEDGRRSYYERYFDIQWGPDNSRKLVVPALGKPYRQALEERELQLTLEPSGFAARYFEHRFPLRLESYRSVLMSGAGAWIGRLGNEHPAVAAWRRVLSAIDGAVTLSPGSKWRISEKRFVKQLLWQTVREHDEARRLVEANLGALNAGGGALDGLLQEQAYTLAYWREARHQMNYRRFFDINELVALRMEDEAAFQDTHSLLFQLVEEGKISGVRIDHIDGLRDPAGYLRRLRESLANRGYPGFFVLIEKVLLGDETLHADWPVSGTTGYDFHHAANAVFVDSRRLEEIDRIYAGFSGVHCGFDEIVSEQKRRAARELFGGELRRLALLLRALAAGDGQTRQCSVEDFADAIVDVTAFLPVYRTYIRSFNVSNADRTAIEAALQGLAGGNPALGFLRRVLTLDGGKDREDRLNFVMSWQQFSGPVMAKGMEDTACYLHNRLISLNSVGGTCRPVSIEQLHQFNLARLQSSELSLNATSTHDTKRSEDVSARINVISEMPALWERSLARWKGWNRSAKSLVRGAPAPSPNDEILLYQTLLGAWPLSEDELPEFRDRIRGFMIKAARESKTHTNWISPEADYENALLAFVDRILDPALSVRFLSDFLRLQESIAPFGAIGSLAQALLKVASPGIPDVYQGTTLWDFSLVDPDNRRPVDFDKRAHMLEELETLARSSAAALVEDLTGHWQDGRIKLYTIWKALTYRRARPDLFLSGDYEPAPVTGSQCDHVIAFTRRNERHQVLVVVPRLLFGMSRGGNPFRNSAMWGDTAIQLPVTGRPCWHNTLDGELHQGGRFLLSSVLKRFPVALLSRVATN